MEASMAQTDQREKIAHLLRRVCFGATQAQIEEYSALGLDRAVERVLDSGLGADSGAILGAEHNPLGLFGSGRRDLALAGGSASRSPREVV
jgi:hypothetical protein